MYGILCVTHPHWLCRGEQVLGRALMCDGVGHGHAHAELAGSRSWVRSVSTCLRIWWAKSAIVGRSVVAIWLQLDRGSQNMERLRTPPALAIHVAFPSVSSWLGGSGLACISRPLVEVSSKATTGRGISRFVAVCAVHPKPP